MLSLDLSGFIVTEIDRFANMNLPNGYIICLVIVVRNGYLVI